MEALIQDAVPQLTKSSVESLCQISSGTPPSPVSPDCLALCTRVVLTREFQLLSSISLFPALSLLRGLDFKNKIIGQSKPHSRTKRVQSTLQLHSELVWKAHKIPSYSI